MAEPPSAALFGTVPLLKITSGRIGAVLSPAILAAREKVFTGRENPTAGKFRTRLAVPTVLFPNRRQTLSLALGALNP